MFVSYHQCISFGETIDCLKAQSSVTYLSIDGVSEHIFIYILHSLSSNNASIDYRYCLSYRSLIPVELNILYTYTNCTVKVVSPYVSILVHLRVYKI